MSVGRERVCAVCGRVLDIYTAASGDTLWAHQIPDLPGEDHPAVPVLPKEITPRYACDFCYADEPKWVLPARSIRWDRIGFARHGSGGDWLTCNECARFIQARDWSGLVDRATASWNYRHVWPMTRQDRAALRKAYRELRGNITGPLYPLAERME